MAKDLVSIDPAETVKKALGAAARLPGVRIDRTAYLQKAFGRHCTDEQLARVISTSPAAAGVPRSVLKHVASTAIKLEAGKVSALSLVAGIPGGWALVGTVPADLAQLVAHMLRIAQKLAYIYSWPELFDRDRDDLDETTEGILILFLGSMFGLQTAQSGLNKISLTLASRAAAQLPRQALTKGVIYPVVKKVAQQLGVKMTKDTFAKGVSKAIPIAGGIVSGGLTLATFVPMARRLESHLSSLELTKLDLRRDPSDPIELVNSGELSVLEPDKGIDGEGGQGSHEGNPEN